MLSRLWLAGGCSLGGAFCWDRRSSSGGTDKNVEEDGDQIHCGATNDSE